MDTSCTPCSLRIRCQEQPADSGPLQRLKEAVGREPSERSEWLDKAWANDAFTFHFQPVVDARGERVHGHEALIRLAAGRQHHEGGEILQAAIERGRVHAFDAYCRQNAIRRSATLLGRGHKLFINFLPGAIHDPGTCLQSTLSALHETSLRPADIVFEVVQSEQVRSLAHLLTVRDFFRDKGFGFALDNTGTGPKTLSMVKQFRPEYLKMDKSCIESDQVDWQGIQRLQEVATWWGAKVIATGVEEPSRADALLKAGVDLMQGWLFGRPAADMKDNQDAALACRTS